MLYCVSNGHFELCYIGKLCAKSTLFLYAQRTQITYYNNHNGPLGKIYKTGSGGN